ncbi:helix-turn-helix domain-containing protein [Rhizobium leguminosarum]|nr:helix-turn-helix domain-containing protein [Rhizobium leguminosarum]MBY5859931.1 helix-turn-helix domain-containing protein [Rhizobium leguminosarum]
MLSISVSTLRVLVRAGELAYVPRGVGAVRQHMGFDTADIEDYIKRTKTRLVPHVKPTSPVAGSFLANRAARLAAKAARKATK